MTNYLTSTKRHLDNPADTGKQAIPGPGGRGSDEHARRVPVEFRATRRQAMIVGALGWRNRANAAVQAALLAEPTELRALEVHVALQHGDYPCHVGSLLRGRLDAQEGDVQDASHFDLLVDLEGEPRIYQLLHSVFLTQRPCLRSKYPAGPRC